MVINYYGNQCFKIQFADTVLAFDPPSRDVVSKAPKFGADVVLVSTRNKNMNGVSQMKFGEKEPFVIKGPGEYEVAGLFIEGFEAPTSYSDSKLTTIYSVLMEGMKLCFLGSMNKFEISSKARETLDDVDILFLPIGGSGVFDSKEAYKTAVSIEPKIIIPMNFVDLKSKELQSFLKEAGVPNLKAQDKITLKKKDILNKEGEVILLSPEI